MNWAKPLWEEIGKFIEMLEDTIEHETIVKFLNYVESRIKCGKCKKHFRNFPRPEKFSTKADVETWFRDLNKDIKKQKMKVNPQKTDSGVTRTNRFSKIKPINKFKQKTI